MRSICIYILTLRRFILTKQQFVTSYQSIRLLLYIEVTKCYLVRNYKFVRYSGREILPIFILINRFSIIICIYKWGYRPLWQRSCHGPYRGKGRLRLPSVLRTSMSRKALRSDKYATKGVMLIYCLFDWLMGIWWYLHLDCCLLLFVDGLWVLLVFDWYIRVYIGHL